MQIDERLQQYTEAYIRLRASMQGIASCATQCDGCQMHRRIAQRALDEADKLLAPAERSAS